MIFFLQGEDINLVCLNEEVIKKIDYYNWFNDEEITKNTQHPYFPNTLAKQLNFLKLTQKTIKINYK